MNRTINPGEIYRHFKGNLYQVLHVAEHTEIGEKNWLYIRLHFVGKSHLSWVWGLKPFLYWGMLLPPYLARSTSG